jgi:hypothetical protein
MAKGDNAKAQVVEKLAQAFGNDYIGCYDKKYYVWANDNGERVQIAITLTCPKVPVGVVSTNTGAGMDFENMNTTVAPAEFVPAEITQEEKDNIQELMRRLGL